MPPKAKPETVTRYMVSLINRDGARVIMGPAQGRCTYATPEEAQAYLEAVTANNSTDNLAQVFGKQSLGTFAVSPVECWAGHFDPVGIYIKAEV